MKVVAIVQARMGSTRLPGKVLMDIGGFSMLERVLLRTRKASQVDDVVVATTLAPEDDQLEEASARIGFSVSRGSTSDVLDRYRQAAQEHDAEAIVRITSDCPLIDPSLIDEVVTKFLNHCPDYASNTLVRSYPRGLDTEVIAREALERAWRDSKVPADRAHVTPYIYLHPDQFRLVSVRGTSDFSDLRWTVDTQVDLDLVRDLYAAARNQIDVTWMEILDLAVADPERFSRNRNVRQKRLEEA